MVKAIRHLLKKIVSCRNMVIKEITNCGLVVFVEELSSILNCLVDIDGLRRFRNPLKWIELIRWLFILNRLDLCFKIENSSFSIKHCCKIIKQLVQYMIIKQLLFRKVILRRNITFQIRIFWFDNSARSQTSYSNTIVLPATRALPASQL